jgi:hypothetical protein
MLAGRLGRRGTPIDGGFHLVGATRNRLKEIRKWIEPLT